MLVQRSIVMFAMPPIQIHYSNVANGLNDLMNQQFKRKIVQTFTMPNSVWNILGVSKVASVQNDFVHRRI